MNMKITDFAFAGKWGDLGASGLAAAIWSDRPLLDESAANISLIKPGMINELATADLRNWRRGPRAMSVESFIVIILNPSKGIRCLPSALWTKPPTGCESYLVRVSLRLPLNNLQKKSLPLALLAK